MVLKKIIVVATILLVFSINMTASLPTTTPALIQNTNLIPIIPGIPMLIATAPSFSVLKAKKKHEHHKKHKHHKKHHHRHHSHSHHDW